MRKKGEREIRFWAPTFTPLAFFSLQKVHAKSFNEKVLVLLGFKLY